MAAPLLVLALEFHRAPLRFRHLTDAQRPLPEGFGDWLAESSAAVAPANVDATADALGTAPAALLDAYLFLLRQILLLQQADHYRVLGLPRHCSSEAIKQHYGLLVRLFHPDRFQENDERSVLLTARINNAYQVLKDPQARRLYDRRFAALSRGTQSNDDPTDFFRPHGPVVTSAARAPTASTLPSWARSVVSWTLGFIAMVTLVYAAVREPRQPVLRVNSDLASGPARGPSYVRGGAKPGASADVPRDGAAPAVGHRDGNAQVREAVAR